MGFYIIPNFYNLEIVTIRFCILTKSLFCAIMNMVESFYHPRGFLKIDIDETIVKAIAIGSGKQIIEELGTAVYAVSVKLFAEFPEDQRNNLETAFNLAMINSVHKAREKHKQ